MKITSLLTTGVLGFNDLGSYIKGVSPILRSIDLQPGASKYLLETGEVLLSAQAGDIYRYFLAGKLAVNDTLTIANGAHVVITHNFNIIPNVTIVENPGTAPTMVVPSAATGIAVTHNTAFTQTTITNTSGSNVILGVRIY
jgi:hypothetical protein